MGDVHEMHRRGSKDCSHQSQQIERLIADFDKMKENLFLVQSSWGKLVSNCVDPALQEDAQRAIVDDAESRGPGSSREKVGVSVISPSLSKSQLSRISSNARALTL